MLIINFEVMRQSSWMNPAVEVQVIRRFGLPVSRLALVGSPAKKSSREVEPGKAFLPRKLITPRWSWPSESPSMCANSTPNFKACLPAKYETLSCTSQYGLGVESRG